MGRFEPIEAETGGLVAGIDEAGRGALAGPVSVGCVVFGLDFFERLGDSHSKESIFISKLDDSKKLSVKARESLLSQVRQHAAFASCMMISNRTIDQIGINPSIEKAVRILIERCNRWLAASRSFSVLIDGNYRFKSLTNAQNVSQVQSIVKGDSRVASIAAASILAKVLRDWRMDRFDRLYRGYDFAKHKGYGTLRHRQKMAELGLSSLHRQSYRLKHSVE